MWSAWPQAQEVIDAAIAELAARSPWLVRFERKLLEQTGECLLRRIDHLALPRETYAARLGEVGYTVEEGLGEIEATAWHPQAYLPRVWLREGEPWRCALSVESVEAFVQRFPDTDPDWEIEGARGAPLRRCRVARDRGAEVWIVERWGATGWGLEDRTQDERNAAREYLDAFRSRPRDERTEPRHDLKDSYAELQKNLEVVIQSLGREWAAALFFRAEREHWMARTPAVDLQRRKQDAWGLGWAHHDHHTYRCSRRWFSSAISVLQLLGLVPRESFHAGAEAGWGAQILEHPGLALVAFVDVDLSEDEVDAGLMASELPQRHQLGTVGLWCALHGESMFAAGLHHLACHVEFDVARAQLERAGVAVMPPFSNLPELKQAFTVGSFRSVSEERLDWLQTVGLLSSSQAEAFAREGALGSHLELIQRRQGYKGFHREGINAIIAETDPRA